MTKTSYFACSVFQKTSRTSEQILADKARRDKESAALRTKLEELTKEMRNKFKKSEPNNSLNKSGQTQDHLPPPEADENAPVDLGDGTIRAVHDRVRRNIVEASRMVGKEPPPPLPVEIRPLLVDDNSRQKVKVEAAVSSMKTDISSDFDSSSEGKAPPRNPRAEGSSNQRSSDSKRISGQNSEKERILQSALSSVMRVSETNGVRTALTSHSNNGNAMHLAGAGIVPLSSEAHGTDESPNVPVRDVSSVPREDADRLKLSEFFARHLKHLEMIRNSDLGINVPQPTTTRNFAFNVDQQSSRRHAPPRQMIPGPTRGVIASAVVDSPPPTLLHYAESTTTEPDDCEDNQTDPFNFMSTVKRAMRDQMIPSGGPTNDDEDDDLTLSEGPLSTSFASSAAAGKEAKAAAKNRRPSREKKKKVPSSSRTNKSKGTKTNNSQKESITSTAVDTTVSHVTEPSNGAPDLVSEGSFL